MNASCTSCEIISAFLLPAGTFDGNYVAKITSGMRARAPHMALSSVVYASFDAFPDLALMLDAPVFFFRNAMEGAQTCAPQSCVWGPRAHQHVGSCLAGICSEPTTFNCARLPRACRRHTHALDHTSEAAVAQAHTAAIYQPRHSWRLFVLCPHPYLNPAAQLPSRLPRW